MRKYSQDFKKDVSVALAVRSVIGLDDLPLELAHMDVVPGRSESDSTALTLFRRGEPGVWVRPVAGGPA